MELRMSEKVFLVFTIVIISAFVSSQSTGEVDNVYADNTDTTNANNVTDDISDFLSELFDELPFVDSSTPVESNNNTTGNGGKNATDMTTNGESATTSAFEWPETDYYSSASTSSSSSSDFDNDELDEDVAAEEERESDNCYQEATVQNFCNAPDDLADLSFWDLYSVLFDDTVLEALIIDCPRGTWCLQDRFDYWDAQMVERAEITMKSDIAADMCKPEMMSCLDTLTSAYSNCSVYPQLVLSYEAIKLMCHLRENPDLHLNCYKQTLVSLHITIADILRESEEGEEDYDEEGVCSDAENTMTQGLICMENACPGEGEAFREFEPWQWFTDGLDDLIYQCGLDPTTCISVLQVGNSSTSIPTTSPMTSSSSSSSENAAVESSWFWGAPDSSLSSSSSSAPEQEYNEKPFGEEMFKQEVGMMVGMSIGATVVAIVMLLLSVTCYKRYRRNAVLKDGYQKLLNDGDES